MENGSFCVSEKIESPIVAFAGMTQSMKRRLKHIDEFAGGVNGVQCQAIAAESISIPLVIMRYLDTVVRHISPKQQLLRLIYKITKNSDSPLCIIRFLEL